MGTAEAIVNSLLEDGEIDPKRLALRTRAQPNTVPTDIVQVAADTILSLPHNGANMQTFHREAARITNEMVAKLEAQTGREALHGLREMLCASMPKPWNYDPGHKISRQYAREIAASFRANSKPMR
jgi:hypothetical protein